MLRRLGVGIAGAVLVDVTLTAAHNETYVATGLPAPVVATWHIRSNLSAQKACFRRLRLVSSRSHPQILGAYRVKTSSQAI